MWSIWVGFILNLFLLNILNFSLRNILGIPKVGTWVASFCPPSFPAHWQCSFLCLEEKSWTCSFISRHSQPNCLQMDGSHCDTSSWQQILFTAVSSSAQTTYFIDINRIFLPRPSRRQKKSLFRACLPLPQRKCEARSLKLAPFCKARPWHYSKAHEILGTRCAVKNNCFHFYNTESQQNSFTYIISFDSNNNPVR